MWSIWKSGKPQKSRQCTEAAEEQTQLLPQPEVDLPAYGAEDFCVEQDITILASPERILPEERRA